MRPALSRPDPTKRKIMTMNRKDAAAGAFFMAVLTLGYSGSFVVNHPYASATKSINARSFGGILRCRCQTRCRGRDWVL